jgi:transposase
MYYRVFHDHSGQTKGPAGFRDPEPTSGSRALGTLPYGFLRPLRLRAGQIRDVARPPVAAVCRQFGLSRESFYQIQQAFQELGFSCFQSRKRGRKGPVKLKGEVLEFVLAQKKENPAIDPGHLAALIQERYGIAIHRTTVLRGLKKKLRSPRKELARSIRRARRSRAGDL